MQGKLKSNLKKLFLIFSVFALAVGVGFGWQAIWHGTSWMVNGSVIDAQKLAENLEYLYNRINKIPLPEDCADGEVLTKVSGEYKCVPIPGCKPNEAIKWDGSKYICVPADGGSCKVKRIINRGGRLGGGFAFDPFNGPFSDSAWGRSLNIAEGENFVAKITEVEDACYGSVVFLEFTCKSGIMSFTGYAHSSWEINCSCFTADSLVTMADGTLKPISQIKPGDKVLGKDGVVNTVKGVEKPKLAGRALYRFNGEGEYFVTAEHPFLTTDGWKSISPQATKQEKPYLAQKLEIKPLQVGDTLITQNGLLKITSIDKLESASEQTVYNLILDGNNTYYVNGFLVHNKAYDN